MRRDVCYTPVVRFSVRIKRLIALKEGFNVRNGNSLKAFADWKGSVSPETSGVG